MGDVQQPRFQAAWHKRRREHMAQSCAALHAHRLHTGGTSALIFYSDNPPACANLDPSDEAAHSSWQSNVDRTSLSDYFLSVYERQLTVDA